MKVVYLLLLAVSATLAWANPSYFPGAEDSDVPDYTPEAENMGGSLPYMANYENQAVAQVHHSFAEIMAQSICTAITGGTPGWIFAVKRQCSNTAGSCAAICTQRTLNEKDSYINRRKMFASGAIHVYENRPSSTIPGTAAKAQVGLMVYRHNNIYRNNCGPNYCCCFVPGF